jgi:hypothetical protein
VEQLGFDLVIDHRFGDGGRWVVVAPPDGTALLALVEPKADSEEDPLKEQHDDITLIVAECRGT